MKIVSVAGARPNFVKIAPLLREMRRHREIESVLVHSGQHYGLEMSEQFFADLEIPAPDLNLGVGSGSHATQTAEVMRRLEPILLEAHPDWLVVVGDVNSTLAAALTGAKLGIPVAHVEAGLRSFDRTMPEEINRRVTDAVSDLLFVTEESGRRNLLREGVAPNAIRLVGNVMIDALQIFRPRWERSAVRERLGLREGSPYSVLTLHRPSNVDDPQTFDGLIGALLEVSRECPIVFPVHPRAAPRLRLRRGIQWRVPGEPQSHAKAGILACPPLGYLDFVALLSQASLALTDSGGVQEETTALGVPCLTLRHNTERPITVTHGTNRVVGTSPAQIAREAFEILAHRPEHRGLPPLWDGKAARRIVDVLLATGTAAGAVATRGIAASTGAA
jgi:UDP-N-acetylglucosamine 2-epimerase (non-hydrolysing)